MTKNMNLMKKIEENNGAYFKGEHMFTINHCGKCDEDFVLKEYDNPAYDSPRVIEFPDVCDECLNNW